MALKKSQLYSSLWQSCDELRWGMDTEVADTEARLDKTRHLKQGMMQKLLTGRIRLMEPGSEDRKHENPELRTSEGGLKYETPEPEFRKVAEHE
jgi:hypothetical protein